MMDIVKSLVICCWFSTYTVVVDCSGGDKMVGPGIWSVLNIEKCADAENYLYDFDIHRKKINRTHDGFDINFVLESPIDETAAIRIDSCKWVDGGCKPYQKLADDSFCGFIKKFAEENFEDILTGVGVDPPDCPIPAGEYELLQYVFNYEDLPDECIYGKFGSDLFIIKDGTDVACIALTVQCSEIE